MNKKLKLCVCAGGIFVCYFYFGIVQERITRGTYQYGDIQEKFTYVLALVGFQCLVNTIYAALLNRFVLRTSEDNTSPYYYGAASLTYLMAMVFSNKALQWVNYPTQVVGKSCKPIPVMVLGVLLGAKQYPLRKYLFVLLIVVGVAMFMYRDSAPTVDTGAAGLGEVLLLLSLAMDGLTGALQERMKTEYKSSSGHMMYHMNLWGVMYLSVALVVTGELFGFIGFVQRHPHVAGELVSFSIASALGQYFIFMTISEFGPLPCSIITTTRKFFTVLGSVFLFGNSLSSRQWLGATAVFAGLVLDSVAGKAPPSAVAANGHKARQLH
ncbi:solute carrier family 35 member B1-like isoform X2 [Pollicipes pollicipes]|uniref:solute carrier family 35 member B1-like isoform X1 n=1 Tax=Pollicipes pollicipes TaxID=41117 RepID=UPI0018849829|nr:solute carrier family 35 member B1-like isoform X1 [Pollicipes pollicipes]XP_037077320.1 solute carrier family 35 member B1-like isoform X2 [Pollicipes pollicipes]